MSNYPLMMRKNMLRFSLPPEIILTWTCLKIFLQQTSHVPSVLLPYTQTHPQMRKKMCLFVICHYETGSITEHDDL